MKKVWAFKVFGVAFLATGLFLAGCNRTKLVDDSEMAQRNAMAENYFDDVNSISNQAAADGDLSSYKMESTDAIASGCATVTRDTTASPRTMTIDFGATNCMCRDGKNRRGKILVSYTGKYSEPGTIITVTFEEYYVNDNHVEGTKTIENMGINAAGHLVYHIVVNGSITLADNGEVHTWTADKYREWIGGQATPRIWADDTFNMWGIRTGTDKRGNDYTATVLEATPLFKTADCRYFVSGIVTFTGGQRSGTKTLDFGNGTCDNTATLTVNGRTKTITLRH